MRNDIDVNGLSGFEPVAVSVGRTFAGSFYADAFSTIGMYSAALMCRARHQEACQNWKFNGHEIVYDCNVKYSVAAVSKGSDLGAVAPLV